MKTGRLVTVPLTAKQFYGYGYSSTVKLWSYENTFCIQKKKKKDFIQQFVSSVSE